MITYAILNLLIQTFIGSLPGKQNILYLHHLENDDLIYFQLDMNSKTRLTFDGYPKDLILTRINSTGNRLYSNPIKNYKSHTYSENFVFIKNNKSITIFDIKNGNLIKEIPTTKTYVFNELVYELKSGKFNLIFDPLNKYEKYSKILNKLNSIFIDQLFLLKNSVVYLEKNNVFILDLQGECIFKTKAQQSIEFMHEISSNFSFKIGDEFYYWTDGSMRKFSLEKFSPVNVFYSSGKIIINNLTFIEIIWANDKNKTKRLFGENQIFGIELFNDKIYYTDDFNSEYRLKVESLE